ncbi:MAG: heavy-metal-associated domain-containing protein [Candidatus Moraniibacteriota bacterium]|nr:MAG: heavy-metal-associated domain-containing protein [Candidatus Moranbacteria bacterium]
MFNFFKSKPKGEKIVFKLSGLHCASCSLNIDGELEEISGVFSSSTSYATQETVVVYDPKLTKPIQFKKSIEKLGYTVLT